MTVFEQILEFLNREMNRPIPYQAFSQSWFHYLALAIAILASVLATLYLRNADDKKLRRFLLGFSGLLLGFEAYKQLIFSYQANWSYQWYAFPFQFCSTPMYVALVAGLTKKKKIQQAWLISWELTDCLRVLRLWSIPTTSLSPPSGSTSRHGSSRSDDGRGNCVVGQQSPAFFQIDLKCGGGVHGFGFDCDPSEFCPYHLDSGRNLQHVFHHPAFRNHLPILSQIEPLVPTPSSS
jgi:hypothetical protein